MARVRGWDIGGAVMQCPMSLPVRYLNVTGDLLTSVKKTEDSLNKLKRSRRSTVAATGPAAGITDDNKIRLQIALDVETYAEQVSRMEWNGWDGINGQNLSMCVQWEWF